MILDNLVYALKKEIDFGRDKHGAYHSPHEHYAVLQEEVDEWWDAIKGDFSDVAHYELLQVAAVALRYILENGDLEIIEDRQNRRHRE